ncbi:MULTISPECIES: hypothetical protein [unclassified Caballeronia]|uniref:hypothetical protein n=1 Tax=unclassified Caballeronia TaxID=2646786 RepID=UPI001F29AD2C|nr:MULTISPECIES: hypothetical protein [unclassified Caballeronia]MCE4547605.1 hypothetical protein [Caballeronia sp. PC1]MCE4575063.1 hypothetical protein [Caballeronia sp. CLC5]
MNAVNLSNDAHESNAALANAIEQCEQALDRMPYRCSEYEALLIASRALLERIKARSPRRSLEIVILLLGVTRLAANGADPEQARKQYDKACSAFAHSAGSANQYFFFLGALGGAAVMMLFVMCVLLLQHSEPTRIYLLQLADSDMFVGVSFFALAGSLTSLLMRLRSIDLVEEDDLRMVAVTGALQPVVAMGFMSVAYAIIATNLIPLNLSGASKSGMMFTIAFLCGFSEKFAPSLLDRVGAALSGSPRKQ